MAEVAAKAAPVLCSAPGQKGFLPAYVPSLRLAATAHIAFTDEQEEPPAGASSTRSMTRSGSLHRSGDADGGATKSITTSV